MDDINALILQLAKALDLKNLLILGENNKGNTLTQITWSKYLQTNDKMDRLTAGGLISLYEKCDIRCQFEHALEKYKTSTNTPSDL